MKYNEYPSINSLSDDDILLIQEATTLAIKKVKLSTLKQYLGISSEDSKVLNPPNGYVKWYRADEVSLNGNLVTSVIDKSSSKNNLIPLIGNPTLVTNAINGKPARNFNNAALKHNAESYAAKTIFSIFRKNTDNIFTDFDGYLIYRAGGFSNKAPASNENIDLLGAKNSKNLLSEYASSGYINNILQNTADLKNHLQGVPFTTGEFHIVEIIYNNSVVGTKNLTVGADTFGDGRYLQNQDIVEIIIYPNLLTSQERSDIYSYFKSYYGFSFL